MLRSSSTRILASLHEAAINIEKPTKTPIALKNLHRLNMIGDPRQAVHMRRTRSEDNLKSSRTVAEDTGQDSPVKFRAINPFKTKFPKLETNPSSSLSRRDGEGEEEACEGVGENLVCHEEEFSFPELGFPGSDTHVGWSEIGGCRYFSSILNGAVDKQSLRENPSALYLATGLGLGGPAPNIQVHKFEDERMEPHLEKLIKENPCNSLILRNYAQYLYKTKRDYKKAEEYYWRAILVEPSDGEIVAEYARLKWESSRDEQAASSYFEHAVQLSPENSHVLGAYASFLWDTDNGEEQDGPLLCQPCYTDP